MYPEGLPNTKERIHRTRECDKTPLECCPTEGTCKRILVVDDEKDIRNVFSKVLSFLGYEVVVARTGTEGLNLFLTNPFDLVLTEFQMPGMDGWSLAVHIKDRFPNTPVVMITGQVKDGVMEKIKGSCVDFVMFKPSRLEDILKTVQRMLDTGSAERSTSASFNNPTTPQERSE
jgi:CheY-like chemotaxis protein